MNFKKIRKKILMVTLSLSIVFSSISFLTINVEASSPTAFEKAFSEQVLVEANKMMGRVRYRLGSKWHSSGHGYSTAHLDTECNGYVRRILVNTVYSLESQGYTVPSAYRGLKTVVSGGLDLRSHLQAINKGFTGSNVINTPSNLKYSNGRPNMAVVGKWLEENIGAGSVVFFEQSGSNGSLHWGIYAGKDPKTGKHMVYHNAGKNSDKGYTSAKYSPFENMWTGKSTGGAYAFQRVYKLTPPIPDTGNALLKKTDTSGNAISGVKFTLYQNDQKTTVNGYSNKSTNSKGEILFEDLPPKTYYAKETYAPSPYLFDSNKWWRFDIKADQTVTVSNGTNGTIRNTVPTGQITISKKGEGSEDIRGAIFDIRNSKGTIVNTITTGTNGKATSKSLPLGKYTVVEKSVPEPYVLDTKPINTELKYKDHKTSIVTSSVTQTNKKATGQITVTKKGEKNENVQGAIFDVKNSKGEIVDTVTTTSNGKVTSKQLPLGNYTVVEKFVPNPYLLDTKAMSVKLEYRNQTTPVVSASVIQTNKEARGKIEIHKQSEVYGNKKQNNVAKAVFDIRNSKGSIVDTITTGTNGKATSKSLPLGKYTVVEKSVPKEYILDPTPKHVELKYKDQLTSIVWSKPNIENTFKPVIKLGLNKIRIDTKPANEGLDVEVWYDKLQNYDWSINDFEETKIKIDLKNKTTNQVITSKTYTAKNFPKEETYHVPSRLLKKDKSSNYEVSISLVNAKQSNQVEINNAVINTDGYTSSERLFDEVARDGMEVNTNFVIRTEKIFGQDMQIWREYFEINVPTYDKLRAGRGYDYNAIVDYKNDLNQDHNMQFSLNSQNELVDGSFYDRGSSYTKIPLDESSKGIYVPQRVYVEKNIKGKVISEKEYNKLSLKNKANYRDGGHQVLTPMWSTDIGTYDLYLESNPIGVNKFSVKLKDDISIYAYMYGWIDEKGASPTIGLDETIVMPISTSDHNNNNSPDMWDSNVMPDNWGLLTSTGGKILTAVEKEFFRLSGNTTLSYLLDGGDFHPDFGSNEITKGNHLVSSRTPLKKGYNFLGWYDAETKRTYQPSDIITIEKETVLEAQWEYSTLLRVTSQNQEGKILGNVAFELSVNQLDVLDSFTTNNQGRLDIKDLSPGEYYIRIKDAPEPYYADKTWKLLTISDQAGSRYDLVVDKSYGQITVKDNEPTSSGKYVIEDKMGNSFELSTNESIILPLGKYTITQTSINFPYVLDNSPKEFELKYINSDTSLYTSTITFENKRTFNVDFNTGGGSAVESQVVLEGKQIQDVPNPFREGYVFAGWDQDIDQLILKDTIFTAKWDSNKFNVAFESDDGTLLDSQEIDYGKSATAPEAPEREGYEFIGWSEDFSSITNNLTIIAEYKLKEYTVIFIDADNKILKTEVVTHYSSATSPEAPERKGYEFTGWSEDFSSITSDLTITAEYKLKEYTVTFKDYDGTVIEVQTVYAGQDLIGEDLEREGHTFIGWDQDLNNIMKDMVVNAIYKINNYKVIYLDHPSDEGHDAEIIEVEYGKEFILNKDTPERSGKFLGWYHSYAEEIMHKGDKFIVDGDIWITGQWEYEVQFVDHEGVLDTQHVLHAKEATPPEDPIREGYKFIEWKNISDPEHEHDENCCVDDEGNPYSEYRITQNTVYEAVWEESGYIMTYDLNGGDNQSDFDSFTIVPGTTFEISSVTPLKEGYTFVGWEDNWGAVYQEQSTYMVRYSEDLVLKALWDKTPSYIALEYDTRLGDSYIPIDQTMSEVYVWEGVYDDNKSDIEDLSNFDYNLKNVTISTNLTNEFGKQGIYTAVYFDKFTKTQGTITNPGLIGVPFFDIKGLGITDISYLFAGASNFNQPLNNWDVSNVTDMNFMFTNANSFNQPLNDWNVSNVTDMSNMFTLASSFNQPLNAWDTSNVTDMQSMLYSASVFNQDLSGWNVENVASWKHFKEQSGLSIENTPLKFRENTLKKGFGN